MAKVATFSDGDNALVVARERLATASLSAVASSDASQQLLAANGLRSGMVIVNTDANALYIKYGTTASATSFTYLIAAGGTWTMPEPVFTGRIDGIWAADGSGSAYITEL